MNLDEGFCNVATNLGNCLVRQHEILKLDLGNPFSIRLWRSLFLKKPDVLHFFSKPSAMGFLLLKLLALRWRGSMTVMSALHPDALNLRKSFLLTKLFAALKPDLVLVQSAIIENMFRSFGSKTAYLLNGVDINKFVPSDQAMKIKLRRKYSIDVNKFIVLHVGHLKKERNLEVFHQIQGGDNQVLIVASTYRKKDQKLRRRLENTGCIVLQRYFPHIEELYGLADCYLFPTTGNNSLLMPLSVLEAMSCNLPVISTKFGILPDIFAASAGLFFVDEDKDYLSYTAQIQKGGIQVNTRQKVMMHSWDSVAERVEQLYRDLMN